MIDLAKQRFVVARLADFCDYRSPAILRERDPILSLWEKLHEVPGPIYELKQQIYDEEVVGFFSKLESGDRRESDLMEFRHFLDRFLSGGDFADASFHITLGNLSEAHRRLDARNFLSELKVCRLLDEERAPGDRRNPDWQKLVAEIYHRLDLDLLELVVRRRPLNARRLPIILRRLRRNVAFYCAVFRLPSHPGETLTPFMLPRVEALVAANQRFLQKLRVS